MYGPCIHYAELFLILSFVHNNLLLSFFAVLATIDNEIQNITLSEGESGNFTCQFSKRDNDITVFWRVGSGQYDCISAEEDIGSDSIGCYTTDTQSVLLIRNVTAGTYPVECVLQQNISSDFVNDESFREEFNKPLTISAFLIVPTGESGLDSE